MWDYTDKVRNHFLHPQHVGQIDKPDMEATVGNMVCGDALRIMVRLDEDGKIAEAKFQTFGCASAIASSDALIELVLGKTVDQAAEITNDDIAEYLGGLPEEKMHCSVLGMEALQKAICAYRGQPFELEDEGTVVCQCFGVTDKLIEKVVTEHNLKTIDEVTHYTKAGGGCRNCHRKIQEIIDKVRGEKVAVVSPSVMKPAGKLTNLQRIRLIEEVIETEIRPVLQKDGGDLDLIDIEGKTVKIAFRGGCSTCRVRQFTADETVGKKLRELVDPEIELEDLTENLS